MNFPIFAARTVTPEMEEFFARLWKTYETPKPTRFMKPSKGSRGLSKPVVIDCLERGMTREEIAEHLGVSIGAVNGFLKRNEIQIQKIRGAA